MRATLYLEGTIEELVEKMRARLEEEGYVFTLSEVSYLVSVEGIRARRRWDWVEFWARKQLGGAYPPHFAMEIEGEMRLGEKDRKVLLEVELIEYHANRPHPGAGASALDECFEAFSKIFSQ